MQDEELEAWVERNPLRVWRKKMRYDGVFTAGKLRSTPGSLKNWERGYVRPSPIKMALIAQLMGVPQSELEVTWDRWQKRSPHTMMDQPASVARPRQ